MSFIIRETRQHKTFQHFVQIPRSDE